MRSRLLIICLAFLSNYILGIEGNKLLHPREELPDDEPDQICGLHPVDILMSSLLRSIQTNDSASVLMLSNAITSLYRTQADFYAFLMRCTTAWNRCQKAQLQRREAPGTLPPLSPSSQSWKLICQAGLSLTQPTEREV